MNELIGGDILYRKWDAAGTPRAVLLLVHGMGAHTARWDFLASYLAARGISSYAIELRGFGRTPERPRGHVDSPRVWERDILTLREIIAAEHPGLKIFALGESLGSLIVFNLAAAYPEAFAGQILISPSFKNGMKFPLSSYLTLICFYLFNPRKTVTVPFTSQMCTRDETYGAVMDANPDELRVSSLKVLMDTMSGQKRAFKAAASASVPALFLLSGKDYLVDPRASRKLFGRLTMTDKTLIDYPEMHHALSIETGRERVFDDMLAWLGSRA
ncbi:MAG: alpha/beta fold hydrolase [Candidatus Aminicenantes bacterium]|nr:alpha/beta fold hydrolase [Candidatus Aminicenantes bacterium]